MNESLNHKLGPLKTWQWGVLIGGAILLYYLYKKNKEGGTESVAQPASESFNTGEPVGQGVSGGSGGGVGESGHSSEQPQAPPAAAAPQEPGAPAPGLGAGQLFATEIGEVVTGAMALREAGLIPPAQGVSHGSTKPKPHRKAGKTAHKAKHGRSSAGAGHGKPTHAQQGSHHHAAVHAGGHTAPGGASGHTGSHGSPHHGAKKQPAPKPKAPAHRHASTHRRRGH